MKLPINDRLLACCSFVRAGERVADVGCDHGYLGIHLLQGGIAASVIASDLRPGPLDCARKNAEKFGLSDKISFFLSDGVQNIPRDFDVLVCAGMGADTIISILSAAPWLQSERYRLILQCQSKTNLLRQYLSDTGWAIGREAVRRDGRFLYTVMEVRWDPAAPRLTPGGCYLPPALLENGDDVTREHCAWVYNELKKIVTSRGEAASEAMKAALTEIEQMK
ncbi:MAG: class I SAM-dependent methyltransferase [Eubacteriales bacterium]|nr:class I SAM-dependent methyltransferase [Eubacteriales bacterium]